MTLPELAFHTIEIVILLLFVSDLKKKNRVNIDEQQPANGENEEALNEVEVFRNG
jgi:hypothetical protein